MQGRERETVLCTEGERGEGLFMALNILGNQFLYAIASYPRIERVSRPTLYSLLPVKGFASFILGNIFFFLFFDPFHSFLEGIIPFLLVSNERLSQLPATKACIVIMALPTPQLTHHRVLYIQTGNAE